MRAAKPAVDLYGDELPTGAVSRLGTVRYRHAGWGTRLYFLGESRTLVSKDEQGRIKYWDVDTGKVTRELDVGRSKAGMAISRDGRTIAALGQKFDRKKREYHSSVKIFNARSTMVRNEIKWVEPMLSESQCIAMSPDEKTIVTGNRRGQVWLWDVETGEELRHHPVSRFDIDDLAFSPDGETIAIVARRSAYLWKYQIKNEPVELPGLARGAMSVSFSPNGDLLATGSDEDNGLRIWNVKTQRLMRRLRGEGRYYPREVCFTSDSKQVAVARSPYSREASGGIDFWDVKTGELVRTVAPNGGFGTIAISRDEKLIAATSGDLIKVFEVDADKQLGRKFLGPQSDVYEFRFTPDGGRLVAASLDGSVRVWNAATGQQEFELNHDPGRMVRGLDISPDGTRLVSSALDDSVRLWSLVDGRPIYRFFGHGDLGGRREVRFVPGGQHFFAWGDDMYLRKWDVRTGKALAEHAIRPHGVEIVEDDEGEVRRDGFRSELANIDQSQFNHDASRLLILLSGTMREFDTASGKELQRIKHDGRLSDFGISPDGKLLATLESVRDGDPGEDGRDGWSTLIRIRDWDSQKLLREIKQTGRFFRYPVFSPDEKLVAVYHSETVGEKRIRKLGIWDVATGKQTHAIESLPSNLYAIAFSPDGIRLATSHDDTTVLIWDLKHFQITDDK